MLFKKHKGEKGNGSIFILIHSFYIICEMLYYQFKVRDVYCNL